MKKVTWDHNCIVSLSSESAQTSFIREQVALQKSGKIIIQIPLISAYENRKGEAKGRLPVKMEDLEHVFKEKIKFLGLNNINFLPRPAFLGDPLLFPSDNLFPIDSEEVSLLKKITEIIHPGLDADKMLEEYKQRDPEADFSPRWNNRYRDILTVLCHITNQGDILVSNDKSIYSKAVELKQFGAGTIVSCNEEGKRTFYTALQ